MADELETRLQSHAKAFEGMLALIPADYYYGKDNSDQWSKKKQSKEEKRAAKKAKLDPANYKSALDVHREREQKRKRELEEEQGITAEGDLVEQPQEGLKRTEKPVKKQKVEHGEAKDQSKPEKKALTPEKDEAIRREKAEKRRQKRERKKEQKQQKRARREAQKAQKRPVDETKASTPKAGAVPGDDRKPKKSDRTQASAKRSQRKDDDSRAADSSGIEASASEDEDESPDAHEPPPSDMDATNAQAGETISGSDDESSETRDTPTFDDSGQQSSTSSTSSIVPPSKPQPTHAEPPTSERPSLGLKTTLTAEPSSDARRESDSASDEESSDKPAFVFEDAQTAPGDGDSQSLSTNGDKSPKLPEMDQAKLKERLEARLTALRTARNADGLNGKPARNRQELIDARRQKEERRKQHKKELRQKAKVEQSAEAEAARLRGGSGSPMWSPNAILSPREPQNSFSFGKVAFGNGEELDTGAGAIVDGKKRKGPQDVKTALEAARKKQDRVSGFDETKRKDIEEKDRWLNAKKRVQGEKIRDNTSLLKKTLKRKEKGKTKSEKEWNERIEGVQAGKEAKQKKREENLRKRKEEKGGGKKTASKAPPKPKRRPGFEGSWKLGSKGGRGP